jgi:hypothetical protein
VVHGAVALVQHRANAVARLRRNERVDRVSRQRGLLFGLKIIRPKESVSDERRGDTGDAQ